MTASTITIERIIETVCEEYGVSVSELKKRKWFSERWGESRRCPRYIIIAKQAVCYLAAKELKMNIKVVAICLRYPNKSNVSYNAKVAGKVLDVDKDFKSQIDSIKQKLFNNQIS